MIDDPTGLARQALLEVTSESTVGAYIDTVDEGDGVISVRFANTMPGYPGWRWTVSVVQIDGDEPTVLEVELMPGDGSLLAPDWVPWSERLADWRSAQGDDSDEAGPDDESDDDEPDDDDADDDESDDDDDDDESDDEVDEDDLDDDLGDDRFDGVDVEEAVAVESDDDDSDDDDDEDDDEADDEADDDEDASDDDARS